MILRDNYFDVQAYLDYQDKIYQLSKYTIDRKWSHLRHLLEWADDTPFHKSAKLELTFPQYLLTARNDGKEKQLSANVIQRACSEARSFYLWAKLNRYYKYKPVNESWIDTIRPGRARGVQSELFEREYYTLEEVRKLCSLKAETLIQRRDKASIAFLFISGMRVGAFVSLPVHCVDLEELTIYQLPSEGVKTKNNKAAKTFLFPIEDLLEIVQEWDEFIRAELGTDAFWFPVLNRDGTEWGNLENPGSIDSRRQSAARGLKRACKAAKIPYRSPHKLRHGHGVYAVQHAKTMAQFKAYSQNMMHESMDITDRLYSRLNSDEVKKVVLGVGKSEEITHDLVKKLIDLLQN